MTTPISAVSEALTILSQRASVGTKKMLSPIYSSGSSSKPAPSATSSSCLTLKQSLMYFKNTSPSTTLLYSAASRLPRNSFAESHKVCSMVFFATSFVFAFFAMVVYKSKTPSLSLRGRPKPIRQRRSFVCYLFLFFRSLAQLLFQSQR